MSLIDCPQEGCDNKVSPEAASCPHCGFPVAQRLKPPSVLEREKIRDGVNYGCGAFVVLPLILILIGVAIVLAISALGGSLPNYNSY